jgi:feruloyl esterase
MRSLIATLLMTTLRLTGVSRTLAASCADLQSLNLPSATVQSAESIEAGQFKAPEHAGEAGFAGAGQAKASDFAELPAFCRVQGTIMTSPMTQVRFEVWLPAGHSWNGRFMVEGFAFYGGTMDPLTLADALRRGYATATTDLGGDGTLHAAYLLHQPERLTDWNYRGWHDTTLAAKRLIAAFYGRAPTYSYWNSCGGGTRQGLQEITRYPDDYDALAAGGLSNGTTSFTFAQVWRWQANHRAGARPIPGTKLALLHQAALGACDARDGVRDGIISDPEHCRFDPAQLQCRSGDAPDCLTAGQVQTAHNMYSPVVDPRNGQVISGPAMPGSELGWDVSGNKPLGLFPAEFFRYLVFQDTDWTYQRRPINFGTDYDLANRPELAAISAGNTDLRPFLRHGGKVLIYMGWNDPAIPPLDHVRFYQGIVSTSGAALTNRGVRFFAIPDMGHCPVADAAPTGYVFDPLPALTAWREQHRAPEQITVTHRTDHHPDRQMRVCRYPAIATYKGHGSTTSADTFRCPISSASHS